MVQPVEEDPIDDTEEPLLSFEGSTKFFSNSFKKSINNEQNEDNGGQDVFELLNYYRTRCAEFDQERKEYIDRFASIESSHETIHRLKWDLKMKNEQIVDLQKGLSEANGELFKQKEKVLQLQAENDALTIQEMEDRRRIQHLLALTQPVTEEVTFFRDCRPGKMTRFPISNDIHSPSKEVNSLSIEAETTPQRYAYSSPQKSARKKIHESGRRVANKKNHSTTTPNTKHTSRVLRTVYLPSEQADSLMKTVQMLKTQMVEQKKLSNERLEAALTRDITDEGMTEEEKTCLRQRTKELEEKLSKAEDALRHTTKDYLVTRHNAQEAERLAHEEIAQVRAQCRRINVEKEEFKRRAQHETRAIREAIQEEGNLCAEEFRKEAILREHDMKILKEQYAAVQVTYTSRIQSLEARLSTLRKKYKDLEKRRRLEIEGFANDTMSLKRQLYKLESMYYGTRLSKHDQASLRFDMTGKRTSKELADEIETLQTRFADLANDIGEFCQEDDQ